MQHGLVHPDGLVDAPEPLVAKILREEDTRHEPQGRRGEQHHAGLGDLLQPRGEVGRLPNGQHLPARALSHLADDHRAGVDAHAKGQRRTVHTGPEGLDDAEARARANALGKMHDSRAGVGVYYRYKPRDVSALCRAHHATTKVHASALRRMAVGVCDYAPGNLGPAETVTTRGADRDEAMEGLGPAAKGLASGPSLLDRVRPSIGLRRMLHLTLVLLSVGAFVVGTLLGDTAPRNKPSALAWTLEGMGAPPWVHDHLLQPFIVDPWLALTFAVPLLVVWWLGWRAKRRMATVFARHWRAACGGGGGGVGPDVEP